LPHASHVSRPRRRNGSFATGIGVRFDGVRLRRLSISATTLAASSGSTIAVWRRACRRGGARRRRDSARCAGSSAATTSLVLRACSADLACSRRGRSRWRASAGGRSKEAAHNAGLFPVDDKLPRARIGGIAEGDASRRALAARVAGSSGIPEALGDHFPLHLGERCDAVNLAVLDAPQELREAGRPVVAPLCPSSSKCSPATNQPRQAIERMNSMHLVRCSLQEAIAGSPSLVTDCRV